MAGASHHPQALHVLVRWEDGAYVARCVEHDIAAEGATVEEAKRAFGEAIIRHVLAARQFEQPLFAGVGAPPPDVKAAWDQTVQAGVKPEPLPIPAFEIRNRSTDGATETDRPPRAELVCV